MMASTPNRMSTAGNSGGSTSGIGGGGGHPFGSSGSGLPSNVTTSGNGVLMSSNIATVGGGLIPSNVAATGGGSVNLNGGFASSTRANGGSATVGINGQNVGPDGNIRVKLTKLQEFKIHGGFFTTKYQMEEGDAHGYEPKEIMAGVIRAVKPNSKLRKFLESSGLMPIKEFLRHIKNHYDLEDSDTVLTQLSETTQGTLEVKEYLAQMMDIRNNVLTLAQEEGFPLPVDMVRRRFLKALAVGLTDDPVRLEFQAFLNKFEDENRVVRLRLRFRAQSP
jgi:hypothetical protein